MATKLPERKGRSAVHITRHIEAAPHREVRALAGTLDTADLQNTTGFDRDAVPTLEALAIELGPHPRAGQRDARVAAEFERRPGHRQLEPGAILRITQQAIRQPECECIHRPRGWHADVPMAQTSRPILNRGLGAGLHHFDGTGAERHGCEPARGERCGAKLGLLKQGAQIVPVGFDAVDDRVGQRCVELRDRCLARRRMRDQFGQHGVVVGRHFATGLDPGIHAQSRGQAHLRQQAARGPKRARRVFGVQARLNGHSLRRVTIGLQRRRLVRRDPQHPFDQIDARDGLGHAVLDLQPRVDFQEVERRGGMVGLPRAVGVDAIGIDNEFDGPGRAVLYRLAEPHRRIAQLRAQPVVERGGWSLFNDLLVAPLRRAVAFAERDDPALAIAEDLHLDVARARYEFLQKYAAVAEIAACQAPYAIEDCGQLRRVRALQHADTAAAGRTLEHDGIADALGLGERLFDIGQQAAAGQQR